MWLVAVLSIRFVVGDCSKAAPVRDVCMDFEPYFNIILGQMINLDMIFHVVVSVY